MNPANSGIARIFWTQAWQVTAMILLVIALTRLFARNRPHLAHGLWVLVLVKCITPPIWSSPSGLFCWLQSGSAAATEDDRRIVSPELATVTPVEIETADPVAVLPDTRLFEVTATEQSGHALLSDGSVTWNIDDEPQSAQPSPVPIEERRKTDAGGNGRIQAILPTIWAGGTLIIFCLAVVPAFVCLWRVKRAGCHHDPALDALVQDLSRRLKLRRRVRLLVTGSRVGPAVVALFRPVIVLPEIIVRGKSPRDLEPILAHELIHVRRGDLWIGMLQSVASAVWWFHPLVWAAGRRVMRESERCCDEEVIAELNCGPAEYARSLLDVLELKQTLKPVPAFPGVRPVDVTSQRLERIMQLGQGCRKRTPWWCWLAMIAAGALTLPGAALTIADEPETHPVQPVDLEDETAETDVFVPQPKPAPLTKRIDKKERAAFEVRSGSLRLFSDSMLEVNTNATAGTARAVEFKGSGLKMELGSEKGPKLQAKADRVKIVAHPALGVPVVSKVPHVDPLFKQLELPGAWIQLEGKVAALVPKGTSPDPDDFLISLRTDKLIIIDAPADNADQKAGIFRNRQLRLEGHVEILVNGKQTSAVRCREAAITLAKHKKGTWKPVRMLFVGDASLMRGDEKNGERITAKSILVYGDNSKIEVSGRITGDSSVRAVPPPKRDVTFKPAEYPAPPPPPKVVRRTPFFTETIENGQRVIRSNWPVPFVHREPLKKAARETTAKPPEDWEELKTRKKSNKDFTVVVYHVGNLVVPMPQALDRIGGKRDGAAERVLKEVEYFQPLVKLIKGVIAPKTWDTAGGEGIIVPETTTLSLVVRQTQKVHKAIAELLQELRRLQDVQVTLEIRVIDVPDTDPLYVKMSVQLETDGLSQSAVVLRESTARSFLTAAQDANRVDVFHVGKVTVFSGHGAELKMSRKSAGKRNSIGKLQFVSAVSKDRRSVRLSVAVDASDALDALANATTARVPDGQTLLIDVDELDARKTGLLGVLTDKNVDRAVRRISSGIHRKVFLLVTPRIVIQEEEEERMGAARAKPRFSSGSQGTVIGTVTPRIIIQEEEEELLGIEFSASAPKPEDKPKR